MFFPDYPLAFYPLAVLAILLAVADRVLAQAKKTKKRRAVT